MRKRWSHGLLGLCLLVASCSVVLAQSSADPVSSARSLAREGQRASALDLLAQRLAEKPGDSDARVLQGIILSWNGDYVASRRDLERVLAEHPGHSDAIAALINVELWSDHPHRAEELALSGLRIDPNNQALLLAYARSLKALHRELEERTALTRLMKLDPGNAVGKQLLVALDENGQHWTAAYDHSFEWFNDGRSTWQESQVSLKRQTGAGPFIARFAHADRFSIGSDQLELDAYPRIRTGTYGYLNAGFSPDSNLYPQYRVGAEIYQSLGHGFEGSGGYRRLSFSGPVNIVTGSLTKYYRGWMFTERTYLTPDDVGTSRSFQFLTRRYMGDAGNYFGIRYGWGASVEDTPSLQSTKVLSSSSYYGEVNWALRHRWTITGKGGIFLEDRIAQTGLRHYLSDLTVNFRF